MPLIDWEYHLEKQRFTKLHQITCGLTGHALDVELKCPTSINELDADGRSALWYAAAHGRLDYVRRLLEQGADPNNGDPPIWAATEGEECYAITKVLLEHSASLNPALCPTYRGGWLPWAWDCSTNSNDHLAIDELLIRNGIDINHSAGFLNVTVMMRMSSEYLCDVCPERMEQLINDGANIEATNEEKRTAIM